MTVVQRMWGASGGMQYVLGQQIQNIVRNYNNMYHIQVNEPTGAWFVVTARKPKKCYHSL